MEVKKRKILIVEDEPAVREGVRDWLEEDGYDVECVETGEEALERIKKMEFGIIVLDLRLPGIDGLQVFEEAKELRPKTKGVIISAFPSKQSVEKAEKLGILDFLPKPFKITDLEKIIRAALGELESKEIGKKHLWLEIGALSYRLCDHDYECSSCSLAQEIQGTFGTVDLLSEKEVQKLKRSPNDQKFCRFGSTYMVHKDKSHLE